MKIGVSVQNYGENSTTDSLKKIGETVENYNLDSIWTSDHVIVKSNDKPWTRVFDSLTTLSFFAGFTENVYLGTSILLAPLRNPFVVGKQIATLDSLSKGRLLLGVGIGWNKSEFEIIGKNFEKRVSETSNCILIWKRLWREDYLKEGFTSEPLPHQKNGPPILIGGQSLPALSRVASIGDGWHPVGISVEDYQKGMEKILEIDHREYLWSLRIPFSANTSLSKTYRGTDGTTRLRLVGNVDEIIDQIGEFHKIGLQHIAFDIREKTIEDYLEQIKILSEIKKTF